MQVFANRKKTQECLSVTMNSLMPVFAPASSAQFQWF